MDKQIRDLGGPDCGWPPADHADFLKVWTKHGGKQVIAFNNEVCRQCPIYSEEQVATHVQNYRRYLELVDEKKEMILRYKEAKSKSKTLRLQEAEKEQS